MSLPFWSEGLRFSCQASGKCCTSRGEYGFVYLTEKDRRRLAEHLGLSLSELNRRCCDRTDGYWHLKDPRADCHFLEGKLCSIYEARPEQCRTWPFWPENLRSVRVWRQEVASFCPGVGKGQLFKAEELCEIVRRQEDDGVAD